MFWSDKCAKDNRQWNSDSVFLGLIDCFGLLILKNCNLPYTYLMWVADDVCNWVTGVVWATGKFIFGITMCFFTTPFYLALLVYPYIFYRFQFFVFINAYIYIYTWFLNGVNSPLICDLCKKQVSSIRIKC